MPLSLFISMHGESECFSSHISVGFQALVMQLWVPLQQNNQLLSVIVKLNEAFCAKKINITISGIFFSTVLLLSSKVTSGCCLQGFMFMQY